jgi:epoxyqueuosine reductase QueG
MESLTQQFVDFAREKRADLIGFAPIERFADVPANHHPSSIFPECRTVIAVAKRITRGSLRGLEEGTQFDIYGQFGLAWLADRTLAVTTTALATWLEDQRWEAVPIQDLPPEVPPSGISVKPGLPAPNVMIDVRHAAVRAGLGELGFCGEVLTPEYGPRQRFQLILTDAPLTATPLATAPVCDQCLACAQSCPLGAIDSAHPVTIAIAGRSFTIGKVDYGKCRSCRNGARPNPYHPAGLPDRLGALCTRSCVDHLDRTRRITNVLAQPFRQRPAWQVDAQGKTSLQA